MFRYQVYCGLAVGSDTSKKTVDRSARLVHSAAATHLESYTVFEAQGCWKGQGEPTLIVEYITDRATDITKVNAFAHEYKWSNHQESVMIVETKPEVRFY